MQAQHLFAEPGNGMSSLSRQRPPRPQHPGQTRRRVLGAAASAFFRVRRASLTIREAWWDRDRRTRIAEMVERERLEAMAQTYAAMARTLEDVRRLPEPAQPPLNS